MPTSRVIVILYAFAATVHVMATAAGPASLAWATAPLLVPLLAGVAFFAAAEAGNRPNRWLLAGLVCGYGFAWIGHFAFEKNQPASFKQPLYSFMGDWVMYRDIWAGKIKI